MQQMDYSCTSFKEQSAREVILEPYKYLSEVPGKEVRALLIASFNKWLNIDDEQLHKIKMVIQMLHNASLLIDDIEDNSKLRRGVPVAHTVYGIASTINCANYVYFLAMDQCYHLGRPEAVQVFLEELLHLHRGQGYDIYWRDNNKCPSEEEYKMMVTEKTGGLFRLAVRLMQVFSENKTDFIPLVNDLGLFFQIRDDYINLQSEKYMLNKSFCEDLTEGKFSFPIIHAILKNPSDHRLQNILKQRTESTELKIYAVEYMKKMGSFEYTKKVIEEYRNSIMEKIDALGGNDQLKKVVEELWSSM
jgi:geranylgeranyl diphosphate synthase type 3